MYFRRFLFRFLRRIFLFSIQKHIENQQSRADTDRHIRDIKCRVMPTTDLNVNKINHESEPRRSITLPTIPARSSASAPRIRSSERGVRQKKYKTKAAATNATTESPQRPVSPLIVEHTKRHARIRRVCKIQEIRNDFLSPPNRRRRTAHAFVAWSITKTAPAATK